MLLYHLIVALNNKGAVLMQTNQQASMLFLQAALEATKAGRAAAKGGNEVMLTNGGAGEGELLEFVNIDESLYFGKAPYEKHNVFIRPIIMNSSLTAYSNDPRMNLEVAAAIALYNQAIAFHRMGLLEDDEPESIRFLCARKLYRKVFQTFQDLKINITRSSGHGIFDLIAMAVHNNLGQIAFNLCEHDLSMSHFKQLLTYAHSIELKQYDEETAHILEWHKIFFRCNFMSIQFPLTASAA